MSQNNNMTTQFQTLFSKNKGYLTRKQLPDKSAYKQLLKLVNAGTVERIKPGVYHYGNATDDATMVDIDKIVSDGVLCLYSAWAHYSLTVQIPQSFHIAIEKNRKVSLPDYPPVSLYYWQEKYYRLGIIRQRIKGYNINIYNLERSVCDAIRFRNKIGMDVASEILKNYLEREDRNLTKLLEYARKTRIEKILKTYLEVQL